jgi:integrase
LALLYQTIFALYANDSFYRALFLFALYGRRWNEIRTLKWTDINFLKNTYTIRAENNKISIDQTYDLPVPIAEALSNIQSKSGLVFKSPITHQELFTPKKQLVKIKEASQIKELTMHYFRHILVSAMGESGVAATILSASLGHTNLNTVNQFYLSANHKKSSATANKAIEELLS